MDEMTDVRVGDNVIYVFGAGDERPAIIVKLWGTTGTANLIVFLDGTNDEAERTSHNGYTFKTSVPRSAERALNRYYTR